MYDICICICMIIHFSINHQIDVNKAWGLSHNSFNFPLFWPEASKPFEIWMCKPVNKSWSYTLVCFRTHSDYQWYLLQVRCIHYTKVKAGSIRNSKCFITFGAWWCQRKTIPIMMNSKMWTRTSIHLRKQRSIIKIKHSSYFGKWTKIKKKPYMVNVTIKNTCAFVHHRILGRHQQRSAIFFFGERNTEKCKSKRRKNEKREIKRNAI